MNDQLMPARQSWAALNGLAHQLLGRATRMTASATRTYTFVQTLQRPTSPPVQRDELVLAPFTPPLRQISSARHPALGWGDAVPDQPEPTTAAPPLRTPGMLSADDLLSLMGS